MRLLGLSLVDLVASMLAWALPTSLIPASILPRRGGGAAACEPGHTPRQTKDPGFKLPPV